ncbi:MAG TPA: hypothetical protein VF808_15745 [Ktedonobacterales bacterium]
MSDATVSAPAALNIPTIEKARRSARRARWRRRGLIALAALVYELVWAISGLDKVNPTDLDVFFFPAVSIALHGHPFDIYQVRVGLIYPNANGPVGLIPVYVAAWLAHLRGWLGDPGLRRMLLFAVVAPVPLLIGWETAHAVKRIAGPLRGVIAIAPYIPMLVAPELWLSALYYGHIEQMIAVWLILAAIRVLNENRALTAGALLGLALLCRSDVLMALFPLALTLLFRLDLSAFARMAFGGALAIAAGLAPFLLADTADTIFSLVTFRDALPVGGGNIWSLGSSAQFLAFGQRYDATLAICLVNALACAVLAIRRDLSIRSMNVYLLLALTALCFPLLIKTLWPYYYQEAALFISVWAIARSIVVARKWRVGERGQILGALSLFWSMRLIVLGAALFAEMSLEVTNYGGWTAPWSTIQALIGVGAILIVGIALSLAPHALKSVIPSQSASERAILLATPVISATDEA